MTDQNNNLEVKPVSSQSRKYILVAEDDKFYSNIFKTKLSGGEFDVTLTGNGEQAMAAIKARKPDLILLDLIMPIKDGFTTLQELKADYQLKDIPVIVLSNLGQDSDVKKAKELGAVDYMIKANVSLHEAVDMVNKYLH